MLKIKGLSKCYNDKIVLDNINLGFEKATSTVVVGESGSGKTTLAKIIIGLESQDRGEVVLDEKPLKELKSRDFQLCSQIQYIFQDPYGFLEPEEKVINVMKEPIKIAMRNKKVPMSMEKALGLVDENLLDYLGQKVKTLSGGQRQKLCIARALVTRPKLIIADECTAMLDKDSRGEINKLLWNLVAKENICLINIAHEVDFVKDKWDKIVVLKDGKVMEDEGFRDFKTHHKTSYAKELIKTFEYFANR